MFARVYTFRHFRCKCTSSFKEKNIKTNSHINENIISCLACVFPCKSSNWVRSGRWGCLVNWFCDQLIAKPGNKTATVSWPDPNILLYAMLGKRWLSKSEPILASLLMDHWKQISDKFEWEYKHIPSWNVSENIVREMAAILSWPGYVNVQSDHAISLWNLTISSSIEMHRRTHVRKKIS